MRSDSQNLSRRTFVTAAAGAASGQPPPRPPLLDAHGLSAVPLIEAGAPDAPALLRSYLTDNAIYLLPEQLSPLYESLANVPLSIDVSTEYGLAYLRENEDALAGLLACAREAFENAG